MWLLKMGYVSSLIKVASFVFCSFFKSIDMYFVSSFSKHYNKIE